MDVPQPTNLINGNFETGNLDGWKTSGNALWKINSTIKKEGLYSAQAGKIGHNQLTAINQAVKVFNSSSLSFWWKVSSEANWDYLLFCLDNPGCTRTGGYAARISGNADWKQVNYTLSPGTHTLTWKYAKDGSVIKGNDTG